MTDLTILEEEIREQPGAVGRLLERETDRVRRIAEDLRGRFNYVVTAARGSSDNAARYGRYLFGVHNNFQVAPATPSLFTLYQNPPDLKGSLIIGISQSGRSPDVVSVIAEGRRQGCPTLAVTNDSKSPLAEEAEYGILLHCGTERAVAASKTYTTSLTALALLSSLLADDSLRLDDLSRLPQWMSETLEGLASVVSQVERYRFMTQCAVIGRGYNFATAFEIALKIKELAHVVAESYSSAEFRHGPIAMIYEGFPVVVIAPDGRVSHDIVSLVSTLRVRSAELLIISENPDLQNQAHLSLPIPSGIPEWLTPIVAVLPGQRFGLALARVKGLDPDHPPGLTKITETL